VIEAIGYYRVWTLFFLQKVVYIIYQNLFVAYKYFSANICKQRTKGHYILDLLWQVRAPAFVCIIISFCREKPFGVSV
jgi:hypothetical protein